MIDIQESYSKHELYIDYRCADKKKVGVLRGDNGAIR